MEPTTDRIQKALTYARLNLQKDLSVEALADIAALSLRQFSRAFREETSQSPTKAIEHLRVEAARLMLEEGRLPIDVIADEVGFGDRERMRRSFIRNIGHPPTSVRRNALQKRPIGTTSRTAAGRLGLHMLGAVALFERDLIIERTRAGVASARKRGKRLGPPVKWQADMARKARSLLDPGGLNAEEVERTLQVSRRPHVRGLAAGARGHEMPT